MPENEACDTQLLQFERSEEGRNPFKAQQASVRRLLPLIVLPLAFRYSWMALFGTVGRASLRS